MVHLSQRIALVAIMLLLAVGGAWAQPPGGRGGDGRGEGFERHPNPAMMLDRCLGTLELTDAQRASIDAIKTRLANAMADAREELAGLKRRLEAAHESGDRDAIRAAMEAIEAVQARIRQMQEAAHQAILDQLTDAQREALRECMEARGGHEGRGGQGGGRHDEGRMDCFAQLDLSPEQMDQIANLRERFRNAHHDLMQEIRNLHGMLREARREGDTTKIARIRAAIAGKMETLRTAQQAFKEAVLRVLTREQRAELEDCQEDREDDGRGNGRGGSINDSRVTPELR